MDNQHYFHGQLGHSNGGAGQAHRQGSNFRPPSVNEALPFSPFSSIVPFDPVVITPPGALPSTSPTAFSTLPEVAKAKNVLEKLSAGAASAENASNRCRQTLRDVQRLIDPDSVTKYQFRAPTRNFNNDNTAPTIMASPPKLSPFAKLVLENTKVAFGMLTPESAKQNKEKKHQQQRITGQVVKPISQNYGKHTEGQSFDSVAVPNGPLSISQGSQRVVIEVSVPANTMTAAKRAEYEKISDEITVGGVATQPKKITNGHRPISADQQTKGDNAVNNLQSLLFEIFEAQDHMEPDTSGLASSGGAAFFTHHDIDGIPSMALQSDVLSKLESHIQRVGAYHRIDDIDVDQLLRIQRLCDNTRGAVDFKFPGYVHDDEEWEQTLIYTERSLVATRVLLRIMGIGSHIKELQSDEFLRNILEGLRDTMEEFIVPTVELKPQSRDKKHESNDDGTYSAVMGHRKSLQTLLHTATKTLRICADVAANSVIDEQELEKLIQACRALVFADNTGTEKDSVYGVQNFETMRRCAMDALAKIFVKYRDARSHIIQQTLNSLEGRINTKQSSRQYHELVEKKPIHLVSALLMRLVQTSATYSADMLKLEKDKSNDADSDDGGGGAEDSSEEYDSDEDEVKVRQKKKLGKSRSTDLNLIAKPLHDSAQQNASNIIGTIIKRALQTSKTSEEPFRRLLDLFTEDFLSVLGSSDWPSAEILLRTLVIQMVSLVESTKSTAASRYMALELLGTMGSGILELQISARNLSRTMESGDASISNRLTGFMEQLEAGNELDTSSLIAFDGPYRMVVEYVQERIQGQNRAHLESARGYHLMQWSQYVLGAHERATDTLVSEDRISPKELSPKLQSMILDAQWLESNHDYPNISSEEGRLAAMVLTLSSTFCRAFNRIFNILLTSMSSDQPTIRSRALKSVAAILDTDPSILDRNKSVMMHIARCSTDTSPLVRASAVSLFEKCTSLRKSLDPAVYERVMERTLDAAVAVRKAAMSLLKKIYLRNESPVMRSGIARSILSRMEDTDDNVVEIARQTMEEIWFQPLYGLNLDGDRAIEAKLKYGAQTALLVQTVELGEGVLKVLESLLKDLLLRSKSAKSNKTVCQMLLLRLFDGIIDNAQIPGSPNQDWILHCLTVFAKACPQLFVPTQLELLEPFTKNLSQHDSLDVYCSVVTVLRYTMPELPMLKPDFMKALQTALFTSVARLPKSQLAEVVSCLWTLNGMLNNPDRLVNFLASVLNNIHGMKGMDLKSDPKISLKVTRLMVLAGQFGKVCDLEEHIKYFKEKLAWAKGNSVSGLVVEVVCSFTSPKQPTTVRETALDAVCAVAQNWPKLYMRPDVTNAFETVFKDHESSLEETLLAGLEGFFCPDDDVEEDEDLPKLGSGVATGTERLVRTYVATDRDGASIAMAQRFLPQITHLALSSCDQVGFIAAKLVISINKQSFVLPKQSAPALVALETCPNSQIANMAFKEHREQHAKRESLFEKEYMRAVQKVFEYQRDVIGSTVGFTGQPPVSKMHLLWTVLKTGKAAVRKKFLTNYSQKLDFNLVTLETTGQTPKHLTFVRFCIENLAFFEYDKIDEQLHLLSCLEKSFSGTGTIVAQAIENDVFRLRVDTLASVGAPDMPIAEPPPIDPVRLHQLAVASQILCLIWETRSFIIRMWNLQKPVARAKQSAKAGPKEVAKAPHRTPNAVAVTESYVKRINDIMAANACPDTQLAICKTFVELISVDTEVKVGSDNDGDDAMETGYETPSEGGSGRSPSLPPSGAGAANKAKRKKSIPSNASTPRKKRRSSFSGKLKASDSDDDADGDWE
ncbi:Hypothetical protein R9X50_00747000 [Acrodontium crateriforme]|uniref:Sister chromatid cohesion protein n=1 Tax=Acrodontium crateriforme TaxID=150365 RepID=A0AAQ3MBW1_9PEZI|nr:Hypothetical protein R9X50_00747000 [Acrodontium crateriforme]